MSTAVTEFRECEDCHEEACFQHRYQAVTFNFCDQHSLSELRRDLARRGRDIWNDLVEVVWLA
jgi:ribosomal protein L29